MKKLMMLAFTLFTAANLFAYDGNMTFDEKEEYCDEVVNWEYDDICTNDVYCESIYWEDEDNCEFIEADHLVDEDYCNSNPFEGTRKTCLEAVKELNKINATEG